MQDREKRPFGVSDAVILVAAIACGLALFRMSLKQSPLTVLEYNLSRAKTLNMRASALLMFVVQAVFPSLTMLTLAVFALRMREPRPAIRRVLRQPGAILCVAEIATIAILSAWSFTLWVSGSMRFVPEAIFLGHAPHVCFATLGAMTALVLSGGWKPEPTWIDRAGRGVGLAWILTTFALWLQYLLV